MRRGGSAANKKKMTSGLLSRANKLHRAVRGAATAATNTIRQNTDGLQSKARGAQAKAGNIKKGLENKSSREIAADGVASVRKYMTTGPHESDFQRDLDTPLYLRTITAADADIMLAYFKWCKQVPSDTGVGSLEMFNRMQDTFVRPRERVYRADTAQNSDSAIQDAEVNITLPNRTYVKGVITGISHDYITCKLSETYRSNAPVDVWWTIAEVRPDGTILEKLYHGSMSTGYNVPTEGSGAGALVPPQYTTITDANRRLRIAMFRAQEDILDAFGFMSIFMIPYHWIKRTNPLSIAIRLVFRTPWRILKWLYGLRNSRLIRWLRIPLNALLHTGISPMHAIGWALLAFALYVLAEDKRSKVYSIVCVTIGIFALRAAANKSDAGRDAGTAIAVEILISVYRVGTLLQIIITSALVVVAGVLAYMDMGITIQAEYIGAWILIRISRIVRLDVSAEGRWRTSQVMLALLVAAHMVRRFVGMEHSLVQLTARAETVMTAAVLGVVIALYDQQDVLPWDIPLRLLAFPLAYIASIALPRSVVLAKGTVNRDMPARLVEFIAGCAALAALAAAFIYTRPITAFTRATDPCNFALTNMHTCKGAADRYVGSQCCRDAVNMVIPSQLVLRTAPANDCMVTIYGTVDCCNVERKAKTDHLMSGVYACMCNGSPIDATGNTLLDDGTCRCGTGFSGTACEIAA